MSFKKYFIKSRMVARFGSFLAVAAMLFAVTASQAFSQNANVAFITSGGNLDTGYDQEFNDFMVGLGYEVTVVDVATVKDGTWGRADAETYGLVVISESPGSGDTVILNDATNGMPDVPFLLCEGYGWPKLGLEEGDIGGSAWIPGAESAATITAAGAAHPVIQAAGLSAGPLDVYTTLPTGNGYTTSGDGLNSAIDILVTAGSANAPVVWALAGGDLAGWTQNTMGIGTPHGGDGEWSNFTDDYIALLTAAFNWLNPLVDPVPVAVAHWPLDTATTTIVEDVIGDNNGNMITGLTASDYIDDGALAEAIRFDALAGIEVPVTAAEDVIDFGDVDFSISMAIRFPSGTYVSSGDSYYLIEKGTISRVEGGATGSRYVIFIKNDALRFEIDNGTADKKSSLLVSGVDFVSGSWIHVVAVRNTATDLMSLYVNGELQTAASPTKDYGSDESGDISNNEPLYIGQSDSGSGIMPGDIDDVRLFDKVLSQVEIDAIGALYNIQPNSTKTWTVYK